MTLTFLKKYIHFDIVGIILFKLVLDYSYITYVSQRYWALGFDLNLNLIKYYEGWLVYLVLFILLKRHEKSMAYITLLISFLLLVVPIISLYTFRDESSSSFYAMVIPYAAMLLSISKFKIQVFYIPHGEKIIIAISVLMVFAVLIHYLKIVGFDNINFNFRNVYEFRSDYALASNEGLYGYLNNWVAKVFNLFLIAISLLYRKYFFTILFVIVQIIIFGLSGHKIVLFSLFILGGIYLLDKFKNPSNVIIFSASIIISLVLVYVSFSQDQMLGSYLIRRAMFVPANLNYVYLEYFSIYDHIYWSNSVLKSFFVYPYETSPPLVIGKYLGFPNMSANIGIFGSGYMHLGVIGIIMYMFIFSILVNIVQQFDRLPVWLVNSIIIVPFTTLFISSDLPTTLLTHGLFVSITVLYLYSSKKNNGIERK